jgi:hypothetical protein
MPPSRPAGAAVAVAPGVDLRRAPLADPMAIALRSENRDFPADEAAIWYGVVAPFAARVAQPPGDAA